MKPAIANHLLLTSCQQRRLFFAAMRDFRYSAASLRFYLLLTVVFVIARLDFLRAAEPLVPWLGDVQRPLARDDTSGLTPLWPADPPLSKETWTAQRKTLRQAWMDFLGPMPTRPASTDFRVLRSDDLPTVTRVLIDYEGEPGLRMQAYLLRPKGNAAPRSRAGLVALHPTTTDTIEPIAGVVGADRDHLGLKLAERGFVVICPRCFLWQDVANYDEAVRQFRMRHPQTLGMHKMLFDAQRAVDLFAALPEVDAQRLGAVGHSLGAKETLYLTAFDDRIRAGVASEGGLGLKSTNWDAPWYLGPEIRDDRFPRNHHELVALIAPRPFLVIAGEQGPGAADGERSWPYLQAAWPLYQLHSESVPLGLLNHRQGHPLPLELFGRVAEWLEAALR